MHAVPSVSAAPPKPLALALLAVGACLVQAFLMDNQVGLYDEGLALYGSAVVAGGGVPYRDFWTLYGPAGFYVLAGFSKLLGASVALERSVDILYKTAVVVLVFCLARRLAPRWLAGAAALFALALLTSSWTYGAPLYAATAGALAAVLLADVRSTAGHVHGRWLAAGAMTGLTLAYRTDMGVYAGVACCAGWLVHHRTAARPGASWPSLVAFAVGAGVVVAAWVAPLLVAVPLADLYDDFVRIPFTVYARNRTLPFPRLDPLRALFERRSLEPLSAYLVYVPFVIVALAAARAWFVLRGRAAVSTVRTADGIAERAPLIVMMIVLAATMTLKGFTRVSVLHMTPALCVSSVVGAWLVAELRFAKRTGRPGVASWSPAPRVVLAIVAVAILVVAGIGLHRRGEAIVRAIAARTPVANCDADVDVRARCFRVDRNTRETVAWVNEHSRPDDAIYVGARRHDKLFANAVAFYFLADRAAPTRWHDLHPGVQTTLVIQREMIADFERRPPALVVLDSQFDDVNEPNASASSGGVHVLDDWLALHYTPVFQRGNYTVYRPVTTS